MQTTTQQTHQAVKFQGETINLHPKILSNLPQILRLAINQPIFKLSGNLQVEVVNAITALLDIKFEDKSQQIKASQIWCSNAHEFHLTPNEIVYAYKLAINHKIQSKDGKTIKVFPNLSISTQAEILNAYLHYKQNHQEYQRAIKYLKQLSTQNAKQEQITLKRIQFYQDEFTFYHYHHEIQTPDPFYQILEPLSPHVKTTFVMRVLNDYRTKAIHDKKLKAYDSYSPAFHFQKCFVEGAIIALQLNKKTIEQWVNFWLQQEDKSNTS